MPDIDKAKIRAAFERAAPSYDANAQFQHRICERLAAKLPSLGLAISDQSCILDAGCGTGYGAELLLRSWPQAKLTACDLSPAMVRMARERGLDATCADLEQMIFAPASVDFCWSSLALQWCRPVLVFPEMARILAPGGKLAFSTLGPGTLHELEFAFSGVDNYRHVLSFSSASEIEAALAGAGFSGIRIESEIWTTHHADFKALFSSIRGIGAGQVGSDRRRTLMGKTAWRTAQARYETLRGQEGLPTSYTVYFGFAEKTAGGI